MDRKSEIATVSPSRRSSSPNCRKASSPARAKSPDRDQDDDVIMTTAFTRLNLHPPSPPRDPAVTRDDPAPRAMTAAVAAAAVPLKDGPERGEAGGGSVVKPVEPTAPVPGGLQHDAPRSGKDTAPTGTRLNASSRPQKSAESGQKQTNTRGDHASIQKDGEDTDGDRKKRQHQATAKEATSESEERLPKTMEGGPESKNIRRHSRGKRVRGEEDSAPAPARRPAKVASNERKAEPVQAGRAAQRRSQEAPTTTAAGTERTSRPKRGRDEDKKPAAVEEAASSDKQSDESCGQQPLMAGTATAVGTEGVLRAKSRTVSEPTSKKSRASLSESNPSQSLVPVRGRYRVVHHRVVPTHGQQSVPRRKSWPASTSTSTAASERRDVRGSSLQLSGGDLPERVTFSGPMTKEEPASSGSPLVVIDGSNVAFAYREGDGRWFAQGPLLVLKFFEQRGVKSVAFVPRIRVRNVTPQDDYYQAFQEAKTKGTISMVPANGNDDLFILKHAIDKKAHVVTNDQFRDHANNSRTLAALGQTKAELRAYLSRYHVCYTFAGDDFVPDPEAPLMRMLTQQASDERREKEANERRERETDERRGKEAGERRDGEAAEPAVLLLTAAPPVA